MNVELDNQGVGVIFKSILSELRGKWVHMNLPEGIFRLWAASECEARLYEDYLAQLLRVAEDTRSRGNLMSPTVIARSASKTLNLGTGLRSWRILKWRGEGHVKSPSSGSLVAKVLRYSITRKVSPREITVILALAYGARTWEEVKDWVGIPNLNPAAVRGLRDSGHLYVETPPEVSLRATTQLRLLASGIACAREILELDKQGAR